MSNLLKNIALMTRKAARAKGSESVASTEYSDSFFIDKVMSVDSKPEAARVGGEYLHVSSLIGMCPRRHLIAYATKVERSKTAAPSMRIVWALGRAAETHVRSQFIDAMEYRSVLGVWKCKCGHTKVSGLYDDTIKCSKCEKKAKTYTEFVLMDHERKIVGSPDMVYVRPDNNKLMVVECKSINKKGYEELNKPHWDHIEQAAAYRQLLLQNGGVVDDYVTIIYVCKDFSFKGPYREFRVKIEGQIQDDVEFMWKMAEDYAKSCESVKNGKTAAYPKRLPLCPSSDTPTAKSCDCVGMCFALPNG